MDRRVTIAWEGVEGSAWSTFSNPNAGSMRTEHGGARRICRPIPIHASSNAYGEDTYRSNPIHGGGSSCNEDWRSTRTQCRGEVQRQPWSLRGSVVLPGARPDYMNCGVGGAVESSSGGRIQFCMPTLPTAPPATSDIGWNPPVFAATAIDTRKRAPTERLSKKRG